MQQKGEISEAPLKRLEGKKTHAGGVAIFFFFKFNKLKSLFSFYPKKAPTSSSDRPLSNKNLLLLPLASTSSKGPRSKWSLEKNYAENKGLKQMSLKSKLHFSWKTNGKRLKLLEKKCGVDEAKKFFLQCIPKHQRLSTLLSLLRDPIKNKKTNEKNLELAQSLLATLPQEDIATLILAVEQRKPSTQKLFHKLLAALPEIKLCGVLHNVLARSKECYIGLNKAFITLLGCSPIKKYQLARSYAP